MTALCGFCALAVDYGFLMVARGQAQTAADAGALAGATTLAFDDFEGLSGSVERNAKAVATANMVAQLPPEFDVTQLPCPQSAGFPPTPVPVRIWACVSVSVYRNRERGNALPTFFGHLVGIDDQGVKASATGMMVPSNASDCVWPLAIPDNWQDNNVVVGAPTPTFVKYDRVTGFPNRATPADAYAPPFFTPPSSTSAESGYQLPVTLRFNLPLTLTPENLVFEETPPGRVVPVRVPRLDAGGFAENLASCGAAPVAIGDLLPIDNSGRLATAALNASARVAADAAARWYPGDPSRASGVQGSCAADAPPCAAMSPRVVILPVFDLNRYEDTRAQGAPSPEIKVVNFVGFFIDRVTGGSIEGHLTTAPGRVVMDKPMVGYDSAFLRTPFLSR
jgi:hypothetical protein